jgi:hypothetical protein
LQRNSKIFSDLAKSVVGSIATAVWFQKTCWFLHIGWYLYRRRSWGLFLDYLCLTTREDRKANWRECLIIWRYSGPRDCKA